MDIEIDRERIISQFKRNGLMINKICLETVSHHLKSLTYPNRHLQQLIKKMNQIVIVEQQQFNEKTLKMGINLLNHKTCTGKAFNTYESFLENVGKWTILQVSPYESIGKFFLGRPEPDAFKFQAEDFLQMNRTRFKKIRDHNVLKSSEMYTFMGVLYQKFFGVKNKIMLQNQINEVELVFPSNFELNLFLIPGCVFIARGQFKSSQLQLIVHKIELPQPLPSLKQNLLSIKLKYICDSISNSKNGLDYTSEDFKKYGTIYNKAQDRQKPVLIFGNFKITPLQVLKVMNIIKQLNNKVECVLLLLEESGHEKLDLKKQLKQIPVFLVPHINSQGPRILPKIPILKHDYNAKVVTNPARFFIQGKQCLFLNYPLVKNLYSKSLISRQIANINANEMAKKISNMLYSQNNIGVTNKIFWKQSSYLDIQSQDIIFIQDNSCPQVHYDNGKGGFVSVGDFQRDGDFICFWPQMKQKIQTCSSKKQ